MGSQCRQSREACELGKEEKTQGQPGVTPHRRDIQAQHHGEACGGGVRKGATADQDRTAQSPADLAGG